MTGKILKKLVSAFIIVGVIPILIVGAIWLGLVTNMGNDATNANREIGHSAMDALNQTSENAKNALNSSTAIAINASINALTKQAENALTQLAKDKALQSDSYLKNIKKITEINMGVIVEIEKANPYIENYSGVINKRINAYLYGEFSGTLKGGIYGYIDGNISGQLGNKSYTVIGPKLGNFPVTKTFFAGEIDANIAGEIVIPQGVYLNGTYNGNSITWTGETQSVNGTIKGITGGVVSGKDAGITIDGIVSGHFRGMHGGAFNGTMNAKITIQTSGEIAGTFNGSIDHLPAFYETLFTEVSDKNPDLQWIYVGKPEIWKFQTNEQLQYILTSLGAVGYNCTKRGWYIQAVNEKTTIITPPYVDAGGAGLMVTVSVPGYFDREKQHLIGVASADVTIQSLATTIMEITTYTTGYAMLVDNNGHLIATKGLNVSFDAWSKTIETENYSLSNNTEFRNVVSKMMQGEEGIAKVNVTKLENFDYGPTGRNSTLGTKYIAYAPIPTTKWAIAIIVPEQEVLADVYTTQNKLNNASDQAINTINQNINNTNSKMDNDINLSVSKVNSSIASVVALITIMLILAIVIAVLLAYLVSNRISAPINKLTKMAERASKGEKVSAEEFEVRTGDEIEDLGKAFGRMSASVEFAKMILEEKEKK
ncbi:MAG: cache domain-containing protein [Thermoplasmata archaeon]